MLSQCCFNSRFLLITRLKIALKFPRLSESSDSSCPLKASSCLHIKLAVSYTHLDVYKRQEQYGVQLAAEVGLSIEVSAR